MVDMENVKVRLLDGRIVSLTPTQVRAVKAIRRTGEYYAYDGISRATIRVLERLGLVTVKWSIRTWTSRRNYRNHSQCEWTARINEGALRR